MIDFDFEYILISSFIGKVDSNTLSISYVVEGKALKLKIFIIANNYKYHNPVMEILNKKIPEFSINLEIIKISVEDYNEYNYIPFKNFLFEKSFLSQ